MVVDNNPNIQEVKARLARSRNLYSLKNKGKTNKKVKTTSNKYLENRTKI